MNSQQLFYRVIIPPCRLQTRVPVFDRDQKDDRLSKGHELDALVFRLWPKTEEPLIETRLQDRMLGPLR